MKANPKKPHATYGSPDVYREAMEEALGMARVQAELGQTFAAIGDDVGAQYALRRLVAYTRAALATMADLEALKAKRGGQ